MSDEPREPEEKPEGSDDAPPPPSIWAGRTRAEKDADRTEVSGADQTEANGGNSEDVEESDGLTDDFDEVGRELSSGMDELEPEPTDTPDPADELADPPDEFAFDEEAGPSAELAEEDEDVSQEEEDPADSDEPAPLADVSPEVAAAAAAGETIEADTLSLADREAAKEAALAGVRARTQQHELEPSQRTAKSPPVKVPVAPPPVRKLTPAAAAPTPKAGPGGAGGAGEPPKRRGFGWRFVAAASLIVMSIAAATAVYSLLFLSDFAEGIGHNKKFASIKSQLVGVDGGVQTIMFLGSDTRAKDPDEIKAGEDPGRSDTTLLARIDPEANTINLLSLPRDLKVNIPGYGVDKLNAAYSFGGQELTLRTVRNLMNIDVNHVVNINFDGFYDAVNAIDCVYIDVDHHYFHSNEGLDPIDYYDEIDVPAGYQRLCGYNALNYVRYRHNDNDLVRGARQQDFVRELRQRIPPEKFFDQSLRDIFIKYTTSDISDANSLLEVLKTLFGARGAQVRQIQFEASSLGDATSGYVTATSSQIKEIRDEFLGTTPPPTPTEPADSGSSDSGSDKPKKKKDDSPPDEAADPGTVDISGGAEDKANEFVKKTNIDFPIFYPTQGLADSTLSGDSRSYRYLGPEGDNTYRAYKYVFEFPSGGLDSSGSYEAFYGVGGTDWADAPILDDPSETRTIDGRDYELFYDGGKLRLVGFKTSDGVYWVDNSLTKLLTEPQMLSIAESMRELKN